MTTLADTVPDEHLACPLCEYDLRGLVDPRCPECGYAFTWDELRDPERRKHKYLFEHHPERNVRSFVRTMLGHLLPRKFWGGLLPSQPSRPRRLAIYALIIALAGLLPTLLYVLREVGQAWTEVSAVRRDWVAYLQSARGAAMARQNYPGQSVSRILDQVAPRPSLPAIVRQAEIGRTLGYLAIVQAVPILWGGFTLASLTILQVSLHRARMRQIHLVRCIVYCADAFLWSQLLVAAAMMIFILRTVTANRLGGYIAWWSDDEIIVSIFAWCVLAMLPIFCYRLIIAFKKYLRFAHPISTILLTQFAVFLAVLVVLIFVTGG